MFAKPKSLPQIRFQDHAIPLIEGSNPIKVRSYHYSYSQKTQIKTMVNEMLAQGVIKPNNNSFLSLSRITFLYLQWINYMISYMEHNIFLTLLCKNPFTTVGKGIPSYVTYHCEVAYGCKFDVSTTGTRLL